MPYIYFKHSFSNTVFKILQLHLSYRFGLESNCVSEAMFPNSVITVSFKLSPAKCPYYFFFELPPYLLLCLWIDSLNVDKSLSYTVLFTESPNCYLQEKQMFVLDIETSSQKKNFKRLKGATKLYFTHYLCAVIILFNTGYTSLHFLLILLEDWLVLSFCSFLCFLPVTLRIWDIFKHLHNHCLST